MNKIDRSAFLYMAPKGAVPDFAQCSSCYAFTGARCALLGVPVAAKMSCGLYVQNGVGDQARGAGLHVERRSSPQEAGLVLENVRCENCCYGGPECELYKALNKAHPGNFALKTEIEPKACCNAFQPK